MLTSANIKQFFMFLDPSEVYYHVRDRPSVKISEELTIIKMWYFDVQCILLVYSILCN